MDIRVGGGSSGLIIGGLRSGDFLVLSEFPAAAAGPEGAGRGRMEGGGKRKRVWDGRGERKGAFNGTEVVGGRW